MAETYASWDAWNVIEDHLIRALQQDSYLRTGGSLAVKTWDQELPEDAGVYQSNLLPAVAVEVYGQRGEEIVGVPDYVDWTFEAAIDVIVAGGELAQVKIATKRYVARIVRVLLEQHQPLKQLDNLPAALDGADAGSVRVTLAGAATVGGRLDSGGGLRGIGEILAAVTVGVATPND